MKPLYTRVKVTKCYTWEDRDGNGSEYTFGSVAAAIGNCTAEMEAGKLWWYSVEELHAFPCHEDAPDGQLYYGMGFCTFREAPRGEESGFEEVIGA